MDVPSPVTRATPAGLVPAGAAFLLTVAVLAVATTKVPGILLVDRFLPGAGALEVVVLGSWAALLAWWMEDPVRATGLRPRIWRLFSLVFFGQLALGLLGAERFLMTGALHPPVPAVVIAGPLFRGGGLFMVILVLATVVLVGPAWCSHLCYVGAWDDLAARTRRGARVLPPWRWIPRVALLALVVLGALGLKAAGVPPGTAGLVALGFGLVGVGVMATLSRRTGAMVHCVVYCPLGLVLDVLGRISPFRLRIDPACTRCGACTRACRYGALDPAHLARRQPGLACTLCGDCLPRCRDSHLSIRFPGLSDTAARRAFIALVASLHAIFLGTARI